MSDVKIECSIIEYTEEHNKLANGKYIQVTIDNNDPSFIKYDEFINKFKSIRDRKGIQSDTATAENPINIEEAFHDIPNIPDYSELLTYILSGSIYPAIEITSTIIVISDLNIILELPWENLFRAAIIFRKCNFKKPSNSLIGASSNLAILMSHAHKGLGHDIKLIMDQEVESIYQILRDLRESNQQSFRVNKILLCKHTTRNTLSEIDWESYNLLHVICHGNLNGDLAFEKDDPSDYKQPDIIEKTDFVNALKKGRFKLVFLSFCNSAGGEDVTESIAVQLIKNGVTDYCIAYREGVGQDSASRFSSTFYEQMRRGKDISETYELSITNYRQLTPSVKYLPYIYTS